LSMAEPEPLDLPGLHPCDPGHGRPRAAYYSWRDPELACAIHCLRCSQIVMAPSPDLAEALWNDAHEDRELSADEATMDTTAELSREDVQVLLGPGQRQYLCDEGLHIIQKLPEGGYACAQCGLGFRESHAIVIETGLAARTEP
jgi:hypothetical protein